MQSFFYNSDIPSKKVGPGIKRKVLAHRKEIMVCELEFEKGSICVFCINIFTHNVLI